jgi:parallel beta-helix repeat protein
VIQHRSLILAVLCALMVLALAVPANSAAAGYWVDQSASNCSGSGPGTQTQPFCTISQGASRAIGGDTVTVKAGTYSEQVTARSGIAGAPVTFQAASGESVTVTGQRYGFYVSGRSHVTIKGFNVADTVSDGFHVSSGSSFIKVLDNRVTSAGTPIDARAKGISVTDSNDVLVQGNVAFDNSSYGIYLVNSTRSTINANESALNAEVSSRKASGIRVHSSSGNTISNNWTAHNEDSGIELVTGSSDNLVVNNVSHDNGDHGIDNLASPNQRIIGNTVLENVTAGINAEGSSTGTTMANNISVDNAINGPRTRGNLRVDSTSTLGSSIDYDLVWLRVPGTMIVWGSTSYSSKASFTTVTSQETHGIEADPRFKDLPARNLRLAANSPAIDSANSGVSGQFATGIEGNPRFDHPAVPDTGAGPRTYDDRGAYEFRPIAEAPVAALSVSPAAGKAPLTVTADASASTDADGDIVSYTFAWGDGSPATGPQASPTASKTYEQTGTFDVTVTVKDSGGRTSQVTKQVLVSNDAPPTAALSVAPSSALAPVEVTADASASTDTEGGTIESYSFDFGDGTPVVGPQASAVATHTYTVPGTYTVTVTVKDNAGQPATATRTVVARANLVGNPGFETALTGWNTSGSGTGVTLERVAGGHGGDWAAKLTNTGTASANCTLNDAPNWVHTTAAGTYTASIWVRADSPGATLKLRLREYASGVLAGSAVKQSVLGTGWTQVSLDYTPVQPGASTLDLNAYVSGAAPGTCFYADDVVMDRGAQTEPPPPSNDPPTAALQVTPQSGSTPLEVTADASASSDPQGPIEAYSFDWGDGSPVTGPQSGPTATHTYTSAGTYTVKATVRDNSGQTAEATAQVVVSAGGGSNLITNPGFESALTGWNSSGSGSGVTLERVSGGHGGAWAAKLANPGSANATCTLNDSPNWVKTTAAGTYAASIWVKADAPGARLKLRIREYAGSTLVGASVQEVTLGTDWQQVALSHVPASPG